MSETFSWDQSRFNATIKEYLVRHQSEVWPKLVNKKAFFVAKAAIPQTPRANPAQIQSDLEREVTATRKDGSMGTVRLGYALAAKRASLNWASSKRFQRAVTRQAFGKAGSGAELKAWRDEIAARYGAILGRRKAASGFLRLGWLYVMKQLGPLTGLRYSPSMPLVGAKMRGMDKGHIIPAAASKLVATIENESLGLIVRQEPADGRRSYSATYTTPGVRVYWSTSYEGGLLGLPRVITNQGHDTHARSLREIKYLVKL